MKNNVFEGIKHVNEHGSEYWSARELYKLLGYTEYGKFLPAIKRAKEACKNSEQAIKDHFAGVSEMIKIAEGTEKEAVRGIENIHLSRYACYLIAQNGDPRKSVFLYDTIVYFLDFLYDGIVYFNHGRIILQIQPMVGRRN